MIAETEEKWKIYEPNLLSEDFFNAGEREE